MIIDATVHLKYNLYIFMQVYDEISGGEKSIWEAIYPLVLEASRFDWVPQIQ